MNILDKFRSLAEQTIETSALRGIFGKNPFPKERMPWINVGNHGSDSGSNPNDTGIKGYFTQKVINLIFGNSASDAGELLLGYMLNNSAYKNNTGTAIGAFITNNGSGYTTGTGVPTVVVTLQGADAAVGSTAVAPAYTAVVDPTNGKVTSLTQTATGSNLTQIPLISFTGGSGSGAAAYIILDNNYLDEKLINPNGGVISKAINDLITNYYNKTQVDSILQNPYSIPQWFEHFGNVTETAQSGNPSGYSESAPISEKGFTVFTPGTASPATAGTTTVYRYDYYRDAGSAPNPVTTPAAGVLTLATSGNTTSGLIALAATAQKSPGNWNRTTEFRFRLCSTNTVFSSNNYLYFGLASNPIQDASLTHFLTSALYFRYEFTQTSGNGSGASGSSFTGNNGACVNSLTGGGTSGSMIYPTNPKEFTSYRIRCDATTYYFEIYKAGAWQLIYSDTHLTTSDLYPFIGIAGGNPNGGAIAIDMLPNLPQFPTALV